MHILEVQEHKARVIYVQGRNEERQVDKWTGGQTDGTIGVR